MASKDPVTSLDQWVGESWAQGEVGATLSYNFLLQDKKAPRAEPEEDIDVLEPEAHNKTLPENQTLSRTEIADATKLENQKSTRISLCTPRESVTELEQDDHLSEALKAQEESEEYIDLLEDASLPPPPFSALSREECFETEGFSSLEREVAEWISDGEMISRSTEDLPSPDVLNIQEQPQTPPLAALFDREVNSALEEMTGDNMAEEVNVTEFNFSPDGKSERINSLSGASVAEINSIHDSPADRNNSDDVFTVSSPPFADESEEEEEVSSNITSCQQQCSSLDIRNEPFQPSYSANISVSAEKTSAQPAVPSAKQQTELLTQSQPEPAPRGANQEVEQQVLSQGSPPLSTVAMELSNQGGAASQGSGCVVVVRERHSRAGERTVGESEQTGGEEGQKEGGLERYKALEQRHCGRLLKVSKTVQTQELKTELYRFISSKHTKMESDLFDDSQSDSGVSADFSPCSTLEGNTTVSPGTPAAPPKETPIEREIRRAIEREHSLRRARGLPNLPISPEYVEIPLRKTVLCQSVTANSERCQGKERQFAGKKMQHEIYEDVQRELDLVKLGTVPGVYDKGTIRQLKERKQLFEVFQKPSDSTSAVSTRNKAISWSSASDISTLDNHEDISSQASTLGGPHVERSLTQSPNSVKGSDSTTLTPRGPSFPEGTGPVIILENNLSIPTQKLYHAKPEEDPITAVNFESSNISSSRTEGHVGIKGREWEEEEEEEEETEVAPKENPFFKLRSSANLVKVEQDIREAQKREKELHKQRISLYGSKGGSKGGGVRGGGGGGRPASLEGKNPTLSSSSLNGLTMPGSPSKGATEPPAARQSAGKFGMWPPAQAEEEINQPEVVHSPRTPRQKTPLVQLWESGLVNGHNKEDN
uniref:uncharacterized protein misp3 n=1 Tax=Scatophagus argus TaxID=75038 RepID=UPI001ED7D5ED|nr:uncharacterized protein misp3 [Scatophagus argus]